MFVPSSRPRRRNPAAQLWSSERFCFPAPEAAIKKARLESGGAYLDSVLPPRMQAADRWRQASQSKEAKTVELQALACGGLQASKRKDGAVGL